MSTLQENSFTCQGCGHDLPESFIMKTPGYCYMCDPEVTLAELLDENRPESVPATVQEHNMTLVTILPTDRKFFDSPDQGHPKCICSRCGERIEEYHFIALRAWDRSDSSEYRYHMGCIGQRERTKEEYEAEMDTYDDDLDLWP